MKNLKQKTLIFCGLLLLAAFPVLAQNTVPSYKDVEIKRKPLSDFKKSVIEQIQTSNLDLSTAFSLEGNIKKADESGKKDSITYIKAEGDKQIVNVAKDFIKALYDSGYFEYFSRLGAESADFELNQDSSKIFGNIELVFKTRQRAKSIESGLKMFKILNLRKDKSEDNESANVDRLLLEGIDIKAEEENLKISFDYQKFFVQELIRKELVKEQNRIKAQDSK